MKKFILWSLYLAIVTLLLAGGINRTASRFGERFDFLFFAVEPTNHDSDRIPGETQANKQEMISQQGSVIGLSARTATIELISGQIVLIERRPWRYALESGLDLQVGDPVLIAGFFEGEVFEVTQITSLSSGQSIPLRDASGHPFWSGTE